MDPVVPVTLGEAIGTEPAWLQAWAFALGFRAGTATAATLDSFTDVRDLQRALKAQGMELQTEADENTTGPAQLYGARPGRQPDSLRSARVGSTHRLWHP